jgi:hypothetical protein
MIGKVFLAILAIFLLFGAFASPISDGIKNWRTDDITENFIVTTGGGVTSSNVTLSRDLFQSSASQVIDLSSNITESPVATSYDDSTGNLLISALNAGDTRTLAVEYYADLEDTVMKAIGPFLAFLIIGGLALAVVYGIWKKKR